MSDNINMQDYHTTTMENIDNLLSLETYLYNNINNLSKGGGAAVTETTNRIRDLKEMRINLLKQLNNMYVQEQNLLSITRSNFVDQQTTGDVLDNSIENLQKNINKLKDEKNNKKRMLKLSDYEYHRTKSHKNILKVLVYSLLVILIAIYIKGTGMVPSIITTVMIIIATSFIMLYLGKALLNNLTRSNLYWHKFQQGDNSQFMTSTTNTNTDRGFISSLFSNSCSDNMKLVNEAYNKSLEELKKAKIKYKETETSNN